MSAFLKKLSVWPPQKSMVSLGKALGWGKAEANTDDVTQDPVVVQRVEGSPNPTGDLPSHLIS